MAVSIFDASITRDTPGVIALGSRPAGAFGSSPGSELVLLDASNASNRLSNAAALIPPAYLTGTNTVGYLTYIYLRDIFGLASVVRIRLDTTNSTDGSGTGPQPADATLWRLGVKIGNQERTFAVTDSSEPIEFSGGVISALVNAAPNQTPQFILFDDTHPNVVKTGDNAYLEFEAAAEWFTTGYVRAPIRVLGSVPRVFNPAGIVRSEIRTFGTLTRLLGGIFRAPTRVFGAVFQGPAGYMRAGIRTFGAVHQTISLGGFTRAGIRTFTRFHVPLSGYLRAPIRTFGVLGQTISLGGFTRAAVRMRGAIGPSGYARAAIRTFGIVTQSADLGGIVRVPVRFIGSTDPIAAPLDAPVVENVVQVRIGGRNASPVEEGPVLTNAGRVRPETLRITKGVNTPGTADFTIVAFSDQVPTIKPVRGDEVIITARGYDEPLLDGHDFRSYLSGMNPATFYSMDEGSLRGAVPAGFARRYGIAQDLGLPAGTTDYSVHLFLRFVGPNDRANVVLDARKQVSGSAIQQWRISFPTAGTIRLDAFTATQRVRRDYPVSVNLDGAGLYHQIIVRANAAGLSLMLNGEALTPPAAVTTAGAPPVTPPANTLRTDSTNVGLVLDEVAFWNRAVPAQDFTTLYSVRKVRRLFGGLVRTPSVTPVGAGDLSTMQVHCKSFAVRAHERKIRGYVRSLTNQSVGALAKTIVNDHMSGEGISLAGVRDSSAITGDVWDYISPAQAFSRICEQANAVWCIDDYRTLWIVGRDNVWDGDIPWEQDYLKEPRLEDDDRQLRTVQTVIGGSPQSGQERDDFNGDGVKREFQLKYRVDRIIEVSLNGVSIDLRGGVWSLDTARSVIVQANSATPISGSDELVVLYNYNFPIVVTRQDNAAVATYGIIHDVHTDTSLDTVEVAETVAEALLARHKAPTTVIASDIRQEAISEVREGWGIRAAFPKLHLPNPTLYLVDRVHITVDGFLVNFNVELLSHDHEPRVGEDWFEAVTRRSIPSELTARVASTNQTPGITPTQLGVEGLRLPVPLGGAEFEWTRSTSWARIPGSGIAPLNGSRLPSNLIEWNATVQCFGGAVAQVRLFNRTTGQQVGQAVETSTANASVVFHRRITLTLGINEYELQIRMKTAPTNVDQGVAGWAGAIQVGD